MNPARQAEYCPILGCFIDPDAPDNMGDLELDREPLDYGDELDEESGSFIQQ